MRDSKMSVIKAALLKLVLVEWRSLAQSGGVSRGLKPSMQITYLQSPQAEKAKYLKTMLSASFDRRSNFLDMR